MSNPNDYTIGWICAIPTEYVTAQELLDEEHEVPETVSPADSNDYTLGRIGSHNVAIAVLPKGQYGHASAATVAKDMLHSFPNIRFGLMVGIGGRGICDYADSHKNKKWQGYAAMAAAVFAKDLLNRIAPNKVQAEKKLREVVDEGFSEMKKNFHYQRLKDWLSPSDPSTNFQRAREQRHADSGQWFLQSDAFTSWRKERHSFLWLNGIPGCGKTILSSAVVEHLEQHNADSLLYFYFDFSDTQKQSLENLIRSLIDQLYHKKEHIRKDVDSFYSANDQGRRRPDMKSLCATFCNLIQQVGEIWIVLDALDECQTRKEYPAGGFLLWMQTLWNSQADIHLLVTSRPEQDIEKSISKWARREDIISLQSDLVGDDIRAYIEARVRTSEELSRWNNRLDIQEEIETTLTIKAKVMFRWVKCQLDVLEKCRSPREARNALVNLPETLDETYSRILDEIPSEQWQYAKRILQFLCYSERPLRINEAVDAVAVDTKSRPRFNPNDRIPVAEEISGYCSNLVVVSTRKIAYEDDEFHRIIDKESTIAEIQLAHFSIKEYLTSGRLQGSAVKDVNEAFKETVARASIAEVCLSYLLDISKFYSRKKPKYPLPKYAARYWALHAKVAERESKPVQTLEIEFLLSKRSYNICWELYKIGERGGPPPALYYASSQGLFLFV